MHICRRAARRAVPAVRRVSSANLQVTSAAVCLDSHICAAGDPGASLSCGLHVYHAATLLAVVVGDLWRFQGPSSRGTLRCRRCLWSSSCCQMPSFCHMVRQNAAQCCGVAPAAFELPLHPSATHRECTSSSHLGLLAADCNWFHSVVIWSGVIRWEVGPALSCDAAGTFKERLMS